MRYCIAADDDAKLWNKSVVTIPSDFRKNHTLDLGSFMTPEQSKHTAVSNGGPLLFRRAEWTQLSREFLVWNVKALFLFLGLAVLGSALLAIGARQSPESAAFSIGELLLFIGFIGCCTVFYQVFRNLNLLKRQYVVYPWGVKERNLIYSRRFHFARCLVSESVTKGRTWLLVAQGRRMAAIDDGFEEFEELRSLLRSRANVVPTVELLRARFSSPHAKRWYALALMLPLVFLPDAYIPGVGFHRGASIGVGVFAGIVFAITFFLLRYSDRKTLEAIESEYGAPDKPDDLHAALEAKKPSLAVERATSGSATRTYRVCGARIWPFAVLAYFAIFASLLSDGEVSAWTGSDWVYNSIFSGIALITTWLAYEGLTTITVDATGLTTTRFGKASRIEFSDVQSIRPTLTALYLDGKNRTVRCSRLHGFLDDLEEVLRERCSHIEDNS